MADPTGHSAFTLSVKRLLSLIQDENNSPDTLFGLASNYFKSQQDMSDGNRATRRLTGSTSSQWSQQQRFERLHHICSEIIWLSEGENWEETQQKTARILGTLLLISPKQGKNLPNIHQRFKPLYKALLSVRLLDKLLQQDREVHPFINAYYDRNRRFTAEPGKLTEFQHMVVIPLMATAIYQDVGLQHPDAARILKGEEGNLSEFRLLAEAEREELLALNAEHSIDFIVNGMGTEKYRGDCESDEKAFNEEQRRRIAFALKLMKSGNKPQQGVGNLIKIPQIYASVVLSTKPHYDMDEVPKVSLLIEKIVENGLVNGTAANALLDITGFFPQGFGVAYIPTDPQGNPADRYEYAVVNQLNPADRMAPRCRTVTRHLNFSSYGTDIVVDKNSNLFFNAPRKQLTQMSEQRLREIMSKLYSLDGRSPGEELLPRSWDPFAYFNERGYQKLWSGSSSG